MTCLIIEDETPAAKRLQAMIEKHQPQARIVSVLDSVAAAVTFLNTHEHPDLIFMDIQLADGQSFDIFESVTVSSPIIFTTAYDEYALQAFRVNSIDYLLKPIEEKELSRALKKYKSQEKNTPPDLSQWRAFLHTVQEPKYKERFLLKIGEEIRFIETADINYVFSDGGMVYAQLQDKRKFHLDFSLDQLTHLLNPDDFFRINRKFIIRLRAINRIFTYFNSRLKIESDPKSPFDLIVSRDRVNDFKRWIDR